MCILKVLSKFNSAFSLYVVAQHSSTHPGFSVLYSALPSEHWCYNTTLIYYHLARLIWSWRRAIHAGSEPGGPASSSSAVCSSSCHCRSSVFPVCFSESYGSWHETTRPGWTSSSNRTRNASILAIVQQMMQGLPPQLMGKTCEVCGSYLSYHPSYMETCYLLLRLIFVG